MADKPTYRELEHRIRELEKIALDHKQVEEELRKSEEKYKTLTDSSLTGIFIHQNGRYVFVNDRFAEIHGYTTKELLGKEYLTLIHADERTTVKEIVSKRLKGDPAPYQYEVRRLTKEGEIIWCEMVATVVEYGGRPAVMGNIINITPRKRAQEALRKSEEKARALLNATTDAVVLLDQQGIILDINDTYAKRFHMNTDEMQGLCFWYLLPPEVTEYKMANVKRVFESGEPGRIVEERQGIWHDTIIYPVCNPRGDVTRVAVFARDITNRKRDEEHIRTLTQQLIKAQESERQRIAHDLHDNVAQDLTLLKIGCDTLLDDQPSASPEIRQKASNLSKILQRSITAVRDMAYDLRPPGLDQLGLVRTAYQYCEEFSEKNGISIDFFAAGLDDLKIPFDTEINLYRIIQEGLWNIKKHADAAHVIVRVVASFPNIILRIEDDGKGFDVKTRLLAASKEKRMGLRSIQERVSLLEGKMRIQSRSTEGTKIYIEVPHKKESCV